MDQYFSDNKQSIVTSNRILYTPSAFAKSSLLHLQEIGSLTARRAHTSSRSNLASYLFFTVVSGAGTLEYGDKRYSLHIGDCVFIDCRSPYSHTTDPDDLWTLQWCHFYGPTMSSVYQKYCERGGRPVFMPSDSTPIFGVLNNLTDVANSNDYMRDMKINEHLSTLVRLIMAQSWHPEDKQLPSKRASVLEVKKYLDEHYCERINLEDLCNQFYISKYYLTHSFKEQFGLSITSYLQILRITKAKQLLRFSSKTVEEIGYETGIGAPAYFSRVFKEVEGVSPSIYREQW